MAKAKKEDRFARRRLRTSYITTLVSMTLVLFMLGILGMVIINARILSKQVKENVGFSIYMNENVKEVNIIKFQKRLDASEFTHSTTYISKEQAEENFKKDIGEDFVEFLGFNPLPSSIDVHLNADYANNDSLAVIEKQLLSNMDVKEVVYHKDLIQKINDNIKKITIALMFFSAVLLVIAIALINNTIRLSVFSKRFLIKSMQLIGATQGFIRRPFIWKGILQGLYSSVLAISMIIGFVFVAMDKLPELEQVKRIDYYGLLFAVILIISILISWVSNYFAVKKYLKIKTDYLYYF